MMEIHNGWKEWSKHVLLELERLGSQQNDIQKEIHEIKMEIAMLKVKSGIWGLISGTIPVAIMLIVKFIK